MACGASGLRGRLRIKAWTVFASPSTPPRLSTTTRCPGWARREVSASTGTETRWRQIETAASGLEVGSAVDVGANVGWFSISLAQMDIPTLAIEREPKFFRTLLYARSELELDHLSVLVTNLDQKSLSAVPKADLLLFLSVWHHMVRALGYAAALDILGELWTRTEQVMFFDTGEDELPAYYGMPALGPTPEEFLTGMLEQVCPGGTVVPCGRHDAFAPNGEPCQRTLYAIFRAAVPTGFPAPL